MGEEVCLKIDPSVIALALAKVGKIYADGLPCFCQMAIDNPMTKSHSGGCLELRNIYKGLTEGRSVDGFVTNEVAAIIGDNKGTNCVFPKKEKPVMLSDVSRLVVNDGDIVILRHPGKLTGEAVGCIKSNAEECFKPRNIHVIVLEEGMDIGVITNGENRLSDEAIDRFNAAIPPMQCDPLLNDRPY